MKIWMLLPFVALVACSNKNSGPSSVLQGELIINGKTAAWDSDLSKSTVALVMVDADRTKSFCTGTLVSKDLVVTAAHCVEPLLSGYQVQVSFGSETYSSKNEGELREIERAYTYEMLYPSHGMTDAMRTINDLKDVALVKLLTSAPKWAVPVPILGSESSLASDQELLIAGFGRTQEDQASMSKFLQWTNVNIVKVEDRRIEVDQTKGTGACWGDSGGPAYVKTDKGLVVVGATSGAAYGDQDCHHHVVYASLPGFRDFLEKVSEVLGGEALVFTE
jgi:secreted trypsin-like serine protease